jgi:hypothetical protein
MLNCFHDSFCVYVNSFPNPSPKLIISLNQNRNLYLSKVFYKELPKRYAGYHNYVYQCANMKTVPLPGMNLEVH